MIVLINASLFIGSRVAISSLIISTIGTLIYKDSTFLTLDLFALIYLILNYHVQDYLNAHDFV